MQTIEKALHQPMPFTTGGQTISDRLTAAKHSLAGSQLGKTICKATTEELMAPKKKHLDYLLHCTNEPNVSIPSMANTLIERTQNPNWTVVYKALITIHNIMCYGNERFSQYLASCNTTFNLGNFYDKASTQNASYNYDQEFGYNSPYFYMTDVCNQGYDMSNHVRRYGKYISEKIATYRVCAFDFCKVKRGREDGLLRTMHTDKLLKTLPILQNQIDALLDFQVVASELSNGVINCSFILLFRDLIRLFACYNDGVINLLEKYFDMNKKQCREALDMYKGFLGRLDKVSDFLKVAESVGIDKGEIPDLTRAPASLLEALEAHLHHLEGGRGPPPSHPPPPQFNAFAAGGFSGGGGPNVGDSERQKFLEMEKEKLRQFEEQKKQQGGSNPFASPPPAATLAQGQQGQGGRPSDDLLDLFTAPAAAQPASDPSNPFANPFAVSGAGSAAQPPPAYANLGQVPSSYSMMSTIPSSTFGADFGRAFPATTSASTSNSLLADSNPFGGAAVTAQPTAAAQQWSPFQQQWGQPQQQQDNSAAGNPFAMQPQPEPVPPEVPQAPSGQSSATPSPLPSAGGAQTQPIGVSSHLGIYDQTPFSRMDGSYTTPSVLGVSELPVAPPVQEDDQFAGQQQAGQFQAAPGGGLDPLATSNGGQQGDVDSALSSLANNLSITGGQQDNQAKPVHWGGPAGGPPGRPVPPTYGAPAPAYSQAAPTSYGAPGMYGQQMPVYSGMPQQQGWGMQQMPMQPGMYGMQQPGGYPMQGMYGMGGYAQPQQTGVQMSQAPPTQPTSQASVDSSNPFGNPFS